MCEIRIEINLTICVEGMTTARAWRPAVPRALLAGPGAISERKQLPAPSQTSPVVEPGCIGVAHGCSVLRGVV